MRIKNIRINSQLESLSNLVIIVGPNGAGKTTYLQDLFSQFIFSGDQAYENSDTKWHDLLSGDFFESTIEEWKVWEHSLVEIKGVSTNNEIMYALPDHLSHQEKGNLLPASQKNNIANSFNRPETTPTELNSKYGNFMRNQHSVFLSVDTRFYINQNHTGQLSEKYSTDVKPATFLATHKDVLDRINKALKIIFDKKIFIEPHNYPQYSIDIGNKDIPSPKLSSSSTEGMIKNKDIYIHWKRENNIKSFPQEGHGIRAAIEILYALENPSREILFIDEPELHLYPTAKYLLGKIIGNYSNGNKQIILSTHDSDFLRGLVQGSKDSSIIRINTDHTVSISAGNQVNKTYSNEILQSAFQDGVIFVEGIADQYVYSNAINLKHLLDGFSFQVIPANGCDRIIENLPFTKELKIKSAVVLDYDTVFVDSRHQKVITSILREKDSQDNLINQVDTLLDAIRFFSKGLLDKKKGTQATLTPDQLLKITELITLLKIAQVFLIPCGELEDWVKLPKTAPAEAVFGRYRKSSSSTYRSLTTFLTEISNSFMP